MSVLGIEQDNHVGARHCRKPLGRRKGLNISTTVRFTKFSASIKILLLLIIVYFVVLLLCVIEFGRIFELHRIH